jgi:2-succinyl-6-hydroxy-2,4-cyclohexadiene-1-carboxylate synthase
MVNLIGLHGFWGSPQEFDPLLVRLKFVKPWIPNLFIPGPLDPTHGFKSWTENFIKAIETRLTSPIVLLGYSQGARLALHAQILRPDLFKQTVLLSAHPGPLSVLERSERKKWIAKWNQKIALLSAEQLEQDWNAQDVFVGSAPVVKPQVDKELLRAALTNWSLLEHQFGWPELKALKGSVTWAYGALDHKFLAVKSELERQNVVGRFVTIPAVGHRLLLDSPQSVADLIKELI